MGYDLHITRQQNWFDEDASRKISLAEWSALIRTDLELQFVSGSEDAGSAIWSSFSNGVLEPVAWFDYYRGNIVVKHPVPVTIVKMISIAGLLAARVQGDDGEFYEHTANGQISYRHEEDDVTARSGKKPWWRFW